MEKDIIAEEAEIYIRSHKNWSRLQRKFYIRICTIFAKSQPVKNYYLEEFRKFSKEFIGISLSEKYFFDEYKKWEENKNEF